MTNQTSKVSVVHGQPSPDEIHQMAFEEGQPAVNGDGYLFTAEEFDLFVERLMSSTPVPVAGGEVLPQRKTGHPELSNHSSYNEGFNTACDQWTPHVTRLQAELDIRKEKHLRSTRIAIGRNHLAKQYHAEVIQLQAEVGRLKDECHQYMQIAASRLLDSKFARSDMTKARELIKSQDDLIRSGNMAARNESTRAKAYELSGKAFLLLASIRASLEG